MALKLHALGQAARSQHSDYIECVHLQLMRAGLRLHAKPVVRDGEREHVNSVQTSRGSESVHIQPWLHESNAQTLHTWFHDFCRPSLYSSSKHEGIKPVSRKRDPQN